MLPETVEVRNLVPDFFCGDTKLFILARWTDSGTYVFKTI
jgi:hypothetical protein